MHAKKMHTWQDEQWQRDEADALLRRDYEDNVFGRDESRGCISPPCRNRFGRVGVYSRAPHIP